MSAVVLTGNCRVVLGRFPENYFDAVVCDPPYELGFMGKGWDKAGVSFDPETWKAVLRVLKPGGHLLAFGGTRTYHRIVVAIEDAGFEIRDMVTWLYGQGFPKSMNVGKAIQKAQGVKAIGSKPASGVGFMNAEGEGGWNVTKNQLVMPEMEGEAAQWEGWGTALKPAVEPIVLARKPFKGTVAKNVLEHGTGALNIDGTRIGTVENLSGGAYAKDGSERHDGAKNWRYKREGGAGEYEQPEGRWPANLILGHHDDCEEVGERQVKTGTYVGRNRDSSEPSGNQIYGQRNADGGKDVTYGQDGIETVADWDCHPDCPVRMLDEQSGDRPSGGSPTRKSREVGLYEDGLKERVITPYTDKGGASRFFYNAKASRKERNAGLDHLDDKPLLWSSGTQSPGTFQSEGTKKSAQNNHPTVKPIALMRYLIRLVTPPGGRVLDPFTGSGTTGIAASLEGFNFVGVELDPEYAALAQTRIKHWSQNA